MSIAISKTYDTLIPAIQRLRNNPKRNAAGFMKREVLTRLLAFSTIFFRGFDFVANMGVAVGKSAGKALRHAGIKKIKPEDVSSKAIRCHFKHALDSIYRNPLQMFDLLVNPGVKRAPYDDTLPKIFQKAVAQQELSEKSSDDLDKDWSLNKYFGHVYVINLTDLPGQKDPTTFQKKLERITNDLNQIGCRTFERLAGSWGKHLPKDIWNRVKDNSFGKRGEALDKQHMGQAGCFMSHYRAIKDASEKHEQASQELKTAQEKLKNASNPAEQVNAQIEVEAAEKKVKDYSSILILEEDNGFGFVDKTDPKAPAVATKNGAGVEFRKVMEELPEDWDMIYFNTVECGPDGGKYMMAKSPTHSEHLNRVQYGLLTNAIAINSRSYKTILNSLSKIEQPKAKYSPVDHEYAKMHSFLKVFSPKRFLSYQNVGDSAITEGSVVKEPWNGTWDRGF